MLILLQVFNNGGENRECFVESAQDQVKLVSLIFAFVQIDFVDVLHPYIEGYFRSSGHRDPFAIENLLMGGGPVGYKVRVVERHLHIAVGLSAQNMEIDIT